MSDDQHILSETSTREAITDLQMRVSYQDHDLRALEAVITRQQAEIDVLRAALAELRQRIAATAESSPASHAPEPPPHY